ncbi:DUF7159 family protein [Mycobacterium malmoense]|uniref:DUF7159 family protein n=1 Tax=Mycobacterium malmoense TaxID=1780 RepID=UPI0008F8B9A8|nr:hypothetical protein [Mycobacterium malmoense]OIN82768.1 hypothetical protein BMG05_00250 [Mycobacterium malmoense]
MVGIVLGVSMAPKKVRMVLVEGEGADGAAVDQDTFDVDGDLSPSTAPNQVLSAILGTREGAAEGGYQLLSTGVTWTDHVEAALLRDALIAHKIENVMLVSAFMAAAALTQAVGDATNYARTALLFVEPYSATLAVVNTADGSISEVRRRVLADDEDQAVAELVEMVSGAEALEARPEGVVVVGSGVDIPLIKPALEAATSLDLSAPDEPEMALARGAALASANAPLFASSTAALAYALDPGTGEVDPLALAGQSPGLLPGYLPEYRGVPELPAAAKKGKPNVAYSAVPDEDADAETVIGLDESAQRRKSVLLAGSALAVIFISAVVALEIALAISIRPTVALRPSPNENIIAPTQPVPAPIPQAKPKVQVPAPVAAPHPMNPPAIAPAPVAPRAVPVPVVPPPVFVPVPRVPLVQPPVGGGRGPFGGGPGPRGPFGGGRGPFGGGPFGGGHGPFGGGPFGGGHGPFGGGPFGGHGLFGGGHGFGGFGGGHGFGGFGHGFGGFGHGFGGFGHGFGGFGHR